MDWHILSLSELEILQKSAVNNGFFANNYGAVNSFLYEEKFHSQIDFKDGWVWSDMRMMENFALVFLTI